MEIIKLNIGGTLVDISIKQLGGLCTLDFMQRVSRRVGKQHLLKKSIILLKAWMTYEASLLGSHAANMATYALYIIVIFLLNNFYDDLHTPLDVFRKFFEFFGREAATFDWNENVLTIFGPIKTLPVPLTDRLRTKADFDIDKLALIDRESDPELSHRALLIQPEDLHEHQMRYAVIRLLSSHNLSKETTSSLDLFLAHAAEQYRKPFSFKHINLIDPCFNSNNLGKSISLFNSH